MENKYVKRMELIIKDRSLEEDISYKCSEDVATKCKFVKDLLKKEREQFIVMFLNIKNQIKGYEIIAEGSMTSAIVHPREVLRSSIIAGAASIVLAHNHPSGDPEPSIDDIEITHRIVKAANICGIDVLDHIVIADKGYFSFKQKNML